MHGRVRASAPAYAKGYGMLHLAGYRELSIYPTHSLILEWTYASTNQRQLKDHRDRGFYGGVRKVRSRSALLKYYCRYLLRLAIAEYKIISYDGETVEFWYVDTKTRKRTEKTYTVKEFIELLIEHLPDRYRHGIHYSGLLAPRSKPACEVFLSCLGKKLRPRPRRIPWRKLIYITYKRDPLRASNGEIFEKTGWWFPGMPEDRAH